jgi:D-methionine transport system permease protein
MGNTGLRAVLALLPVPTAETLYMTLASTVLAALMGFPLGTYLYSAAPGGLHPRPLLYTVISRLVNLFRSMPFIILIILVFPLSRFIVKTSIGPTATIIPLSLAASPFVARIVESALAEVEPGVLVAARAMGSTSLQIILKVLVPEALPALVSGLSLTIINLIGYSAMAGAVGGGGLGHLAISYGYHRFRMDVTIAAVVVILAMVELIQKAGSDMSRHLLSRR